MELINKNTTQGQNVRRLLKALTYWYLLLVERAHLIGLRCVSQAKQSGLVRNFHRIGDKWSEAVLQIYGNVAHLRSALLQQKRTLNLGRYLNVNHTRIQNKKAGHKKNKTTCFNTVFYLFIHSKCQLSFLLNDKVGTVLEILKKNYIIYNKQNVVTFIFKLGYFIVSRLCTQA